MEDISVEQRCAYTYYEAGRSILEVKRDGILEKESSREMIGEKKKEETWRNEKYIRPDAFKPGPPRGINKI